MVGVDQDGTKVATVAKRGRFDGYSPSLDELTGLGPEADRDGAIIALSLRCGWSSIRLSALFSITERRVQQIVAAFRSEYEESL